MRITTLLAASLLLVAAVSAAVAGPVSPFGAPLACPASGPTSVLAVAQKTPGFAASESDLAWALKSMDRIGYSAKPPASGAARDAAMLSAALLRRGNLVAAKMANDEAQKDVAGYKSSQFASSFESLLTVLTQPVQHASYPESVRAEGEKWPADADHSRTHGVDLEQSSASLAEVITRAAAAQKALGDYYRKPAVRYYILANGFRDDIALTAAAAAVCAEKLNAATQSKLNISARFMAMPSQVASEPSKK